MKTETERHMLPRSTNLGMTAAAALTVMAAAAVPAQADPMFSIGLQQDGVEAVGGEANDHAHRPRRIGLRPSAPRHGRQRGSARGQMQKSSAGKFHLNLPFRSDHSMQSSRPRGVGFRLFPPPSPASTTPAASFSRTPPSRPRASPRRIAVLVRSLRFP